MSSPLRPLRQTRRHHRWIALVAILSLLFQQFALAGHLCLGEHAPPATHAAASDPPPCHDEGGTPDPAELLECAQHCSSVTPSADLPPAPSVPVMLPFTGWLLVATSAGDPTRMPPHARVPLRATPPPLAIRHCSWQI